MAQAGGTAYSLAASNLNMGWNLVATGESVTPADFSLTTGNVITLWAWENASSTWYFHAPALAANGTMASYLANKGYQDFGSQTLGNGRGFWVNYTGTVGGTAGVTVNGIVLNTTAPALNVATGATSWSSGNVSLTLIYTNLVNTLNIRVQSTGGFLGDAGTTSANGGNCSLATGGTYPTCSSLGIAFDPSAGTVTFNNTPITYSTAGGPASISGTLNFVPASLSPAVTGISPTTGSVGTTVTISGSNFDKFTPAPLVKVGSITATSSLVNATTITAVVPAILAAGNSSIVISNGDGSGGITAGTFTVTSGTPPSAPTVWFSGASQTLTQTGASQVLVSIGYPTTGITSYNIYRATTPNVAISSGNRISSRTVANAFTALSFADTGLTPMTTYYYRLTAVSSGGESAGSTELHITPANVSTLVANTYPSTALPALAAFPAASGFGSGLYNGSMVTDGTNLYLIDGSVIRKVSVATGAVSTFAANLAHPPRVMTARDGNLYVLDSFGYLNTITLANATVSSISPTGALFNPNGLTGGMVSDGVNVYFSHLNNSGGYQISRMVISSGLVSVLAGNAASAGSIDGSGTSARFSGPVQLVLVGATLYVADRTNIRAIDTASAAVTTITGTGTSIITGGTTIGDGIATPVAGCTALTSDASHLYGICNRRLMKMVLANAEVITIAGAVGVAGYTDGVGAAARFATDGSMSSVVVIGSALYVWDFGNASIRRVQ